MKKTLYLTRGCQKNDHLRKIWMTMKLSVILFFVSLTQLMANETYAQLTKLTLQLKDATVKEVLNQIEDKSEFFFLYNSKLVDVDRKVSVEFKDQKISEVLNSIFQGADVAYTVVDRQIVLTKKADQNGFTEIINQQQQQKITGIVTDENGIPLPGVNVQIEGTTIGVNADINGKYLINKTDENVILVFSFIGYNTQKVSASGKITIDIKMVPAITGLDEVVVVGYGTQKAATLSGSVATLRGNELTSLPVDNLATGLQGKVAGLITYNTTSEPGNAGATQMLIRGQNTLGDNSPLIVVDGIASRGFQHIDANDIESYSVLKDASAAIYGAQAANGVILITTKRGKTGKPSVTISYNSGISSPTRLPQMADAYTYSSMVNEIYPGTFTDNSIQKYQDGTDRLRYPNTNWYDATIKKSSAQRSGNVLMNGGTENIKYLISLGSKYNDAIYKNSAENYTQYNFRSNVDANLNKDISVSLDLAGRKENYKKPIADNYTIYRSIIRGRPTEIAQWPTGQYVPGTEGASPNALVTTMPGYDNSTNYMLESNLKLKINIPWVKGLSLSSNMSYDKSFNNHKNWNTPYPLYTWDKINVDGSGNPVLTKARYGPVSPTLSVDMTDGVSITANLLANYETSINSQHNIKVLLGTERHTWNQAYLQASRANFISTALPSLFAGAFDDQRSNYGNDQYNARLNYFGRLNYDYKQKFLAEFVFRYDGSDIFPTNKQFGFFPAVSLGYRISQETFFKDAITFINDLKIRGSWGQTGNDRVNRNQFLAAYTFNDFGAVFGQGQGATLQKTMYEYKMPNPNITWEVANQRNVGLDATLLNNKLTVSFDYFNNLRTNLLLPNTAVNPELTGFSLPDVNAGKVKNVGVEFIIGYDDKIGDFRYGASLNLTNTKNTIVYMAETPGIPTYQQRTGHPIQGDLYYQADGIFQTQAECDEYNAKITGGITNGKVVPGDIRFKDVNNDGTIDGKDIVRDFRSKIPTLIGGLSLNFGWKWFDINLLFQGASGAVASVWNGEAGNMGNYLKEYADNRWTPANSNSEYPRTWDRTNVYWTQYKNTFWLRSTDYIRLKNIELGFNTGNGFNKKLGIQALRFFVNGYNLLTMDKFHIADPESAANDGSFYSYPLNKTINGGIKLTF